MKSYTYRFITNKPAKEIYPLLLDIKYWWSGFYEETITGSSRHIGDEFTFSAGGGMHGTKQKLVELIPNRKIVWKVIESKLAFLNEPDEWNDTSLRFELHQRNEKETEVVFTHLGLEPQVECYNQCTSAWAQYLSQLETKVNAA